MQINHARVCGIQICCKTAAGLIAACVYNFHSKINDRNKFKSVQPYYIFKTQVHFINLNNNIMHIHSISMSMSGFDPMRARM